MTNDPLYLDLSYETVRGKTSQMLILDAADFIILVGKRINVLISLVTRHLQLLRDIWLKRVSNELSLSDIYSGLISDSFVAFISSRVKEQIMHN